MAKQTFFKELARSLWSWCSFLAYVGMGLVFVYLLGLFLKWSATHSHSL
jgi:hypothetical protein